METKEQDDIPTPELVETYLLGRFNFWYSDCDLAPTAAALMVLAEIVSEK